ncbi:MAG: PQQ-dependent sugar dehydrogenase [Polyangiaceae bacterium]
MGSRLPLWASFGFLMACPSSQPPPQPTGVLLGDWTTDAPGVRRRLTQADLAQPYATPSKDNGPKLVDRPQGFLPRVPNGFSVNVFAQELDKPRMLRVAPNGDVFVVESEAGRVRVLRDHDGDGVAEVNVPFATGLDRPFGVNFYPPGARPSHVYVANTGSVVRFPYKNDALAPLGEANVVVPDISAGGLLRGGGHWTRDLVFSNDGSKMYVSIGSKSNVSDDEDENDRARIFEYSPEGKNGRVFATGLRNPVGLAIHPTTGELWTTVNERDELGDHLVPDYVTVVREGGFYGWPWYYIGPHQDPRHKGKHPELAAKVLVPDVLVQSHSALLGMTFMRGAKFPPEYRTFAASHGSWNRARRTGYKVVMLPLTPEGRATGEYVDFMTGFVAANGDVYGRPVAVAEAIDGSLLVSDDGAGVVWRIRYLGK